MHKLVIWESEVNCLTLFDISFLLIAVLNKTWLFAVVCLKWWDLLKTRHCLTFPVSAEAIRAAGSFAFYCVVQPQCECSESGVIALWSFLNFDGCIIGNCQSMVIVSYNFHRYASVDMLYVMSHSSCFVSFLIVFHWCVYCLFRFKIKISMLTVCSTITNLPLCTCVDGKIKRGRA